MRAISACIKRAAVQARIPRASTALPVPAVNVVHTTACMSLRSFHTTPSFASAVDDTHRVVKHAVSGAAGMLPRTLKKDNIVGEGTPPAHHSAKGFMNPWPSYKEYGPWDFFRHALPELQHLDTYELARVTPHFEAMHAPIDSLQVTWIGHVTFLIQMGGWNVLTDPVFSARASPVQWFGPKRYTPPAAKIEELPPIHAVLISHNHYDHCDAGSIAALLEKEALDREKDPNYSGISFFCPLGTSPLLSSLGLSSHRISTLDWWQTAILQRESNNNPPSVQVLEPGLDGARVGGQLEVLCVPAQHQSARTAWDRNVSLWSGFLITTHNNTTSANTTPHTRKCYFSGDTGYRHVGKGVAPLSAEEANAPVCPAFAQLGEEFGPVDIALLPIGAYSPRWFMSSVHASPEDAVAMHLDVKSKRSIGMHWGTFPLTDEPIEEPPKRLAAAREHFGVAPDAFHVVKPGTLVTASTGVVQPDGLIC